MNQNKSQKNLNYLKQVVSQQPVETPPVLTRTQLLTAVSGEREAGGRRRSAVNWAAWGAMSIAILVLLWGIVKPGIVLQWNWQNGDVTTFEVYRAPEGSDEFTLVSQIPTQEAYTEYTFVDPKLVPGETYTYRIEGVTSSGQSKFTQAVTDNASSALPGQLALLVASLGLAYGILIAPKTFGQFSFKNTKNLTI